ncbi:hypothetical protein CesoFtcFv8_027523 [Champsocephalus esox]|uniref:Uncharacterized protein n=1 Tax=Champsocephalus esox TaxID=159716 RepID=A0AAN7YDH9_9TELE|nr:hypothetical protein CesoFtcFv8_027523 [Champsocephalus esox]
MVKRELLLRQFAREHEEDSQKERNRECLTVWLHNSATRHIQRASPQLNGGRAHLSPAQSLPCNLLA